MAYKDIAGDIIVNNFKIVFGTFSFNETHTVLSIPYTGTANPAATADLSTYDYSLNGTTWTAMTPEVGTDVTGLSFTPTGASLSFNWEIKQDIGDNIYNREIFIRFQATSGTMTTTLKTYRLYFEKIVSNLTNVQSVSALPDDYQGIPGSDLLKNAPKAGR